MESQPHRDDYSPSPSEARDVLSSLDVDGSRLAARVVTPWWYHVTLAVIVVMFVGSQALPSPFSVSVMALGLVAIPILVIAYTRRYGVSISQPAGPRSGRLLFACVGVLVGAMVTGIVIKFAELDPWWVLVPAVIAAVLMVVLGRRYDDALRSELARVSGGGA